MSFESSSRESVERDLEEARQRLVLHRYDQDERHTEAVLSTPTTLEHHREHGLPPTQLRNGSYGSVSTLQSIQQKAPPKVKRYRIPFLILIAFDFGMVIFLSIICSEVSQILMRHQSLRVEVYNNKLSHSKTLVLMGCV